MRALREKDGGSPSTRVQNENDTASRAHGGKEYGGANEGEYTVSDDVEHGRRAKRPPAEQPLSGSVSRAPVRFLADDCYCGLSYRYDLDLFYLSSHVSFTPWNSIVCTCHRMYQYQCDTATLRMQPKALPTCSTRQNPPEKKSAGSYPRYQRAHFDVVLSVDGDGQAQGESGADGRHITHSFERPAHPQEFVLRTLIQNKLYA